jgi:hypothetical protein
MHLWIITYFPELHYLQTHARTHTHTHACAHTHPHTRTRTHTRTECRICLRSELHSADGLPHSKISFISRHAINFLHFSWLAALSSDILANISDNVHEFGRYQNQDSNPGNLEKPTGFMVTQRNARSWTQNYLLVVPNAYFTNIIWFFV